MPTYLAETLPVLAPEGKLERGCMVLICDSMVGRKMLDEYHSYCSGSGKLHSTSPRAILALPLQYTWYLSQISLPTMLLHIQTV